MKSKPVVILVHTDAVYPGDPCKAFIAGVVQEHFDRSLAVIDWTESYVHTKHQTALPDWITPYTVNANGIRVVYPGRNYQVFNPHELEWRQLVEKDGQLEVILMGGEFGACHHLALRDLVEVFGSRLQRVQIPLQGVFTSQLQPLSLDMPDMGPQLKKYEALMGISPRYDPEKNAFVFEQMN